jgi:hypothetical protein
MVAMLGRSTTTVVSVIATAAIVALASAAPLALQALDIRVPTAVVANHSGERTTATREAPAQLAVTPATGQPVAAGDFHASWVRQSEPASLAPGESTTLTVTFRNTGTASWVRGVLGRQANLGVSGEGAGLASNWPSADRVAVQAESVVPPGGVGTFSFAVRAPATPGSYRLDLRPVIDGTTWMENQGVHVMFSSQVLADRGAAVSAVLSQVSTVALAIFLITLLFVLLKLGAAAGRSRLASSTAGR